MVFNMSTSTTWGLPSSAAWRDARNRSTTAPISSSRGAARGRRRTSPQPKLPGLASVQATFCRSRSSFEDPVTATALRAQATAWPWIRPQGAAKFRLLYLNGGGSGVALGWQRQKRKGQLQLVSCT